MARDGDLSWFLEVWNVSFCWVLSQGSKTVKCFSEMRFLLHDFFNSLRCIYLKMSRMDYWLRGSELGVLDIVRSDVILVSKGAFSFSIELCAVVNEIHC